MADKSGIEWTDATWNPVRGCAKVSEGCRNCYAMRQAARMDHPAREGVKEGAYYGLTKSSDKGPVWTGRAREVPHLLDQPLRWTKPRRIFVNSMSDLFHDDISISFIRQVFETMVRASHHQFQLLTKRPKRMRDVLRNMYAFDGTHRLYASQPARNIWIGVSVEDQATADERIQLLLETPAAVRWLSMEPLLGPVDLSEWVDADSCDMDYYRRDGASPDWIVVGGESGPRARECDVTWIVDIVEQCQEANVPVFVKQLGAEVTYGGMDPKADPKTTGANVKHPTVAALRSMKHTKGADWSEWPEHLRVREMPIVPPSVTVHPF